MVNYNNSEIYKIESIHGNGPVLMGSTTCEKLNLRVAATLRAVLS